jgi:serine/threonine protein kinase
MGNIESQQELLPPFTSLDLSNKSIATVSTSIEESIINAKSIVFSTSKTTKGLLIACEQIKTASEPLIKAVNSEKLTCEKVIEMLGGGKDFVSSFLHDVQNAKRFSIDPVSASKSFTQGGFGQIVSTSSTIKTIHGSDIRREVVVKLVKASKPKNGAGNLIEPAILTTLRHPSLMPALAIDINPRTSEMQIVMPPGIADVAMVCKRHRIPLSRRVLHRWGVTIASGLMHLHANGVAHGDVKPGNFIIYPAVAEEETAARLASALDSTLSLIGVIRRLPNRSFEINPPLADIRDICKDVASALLELTTIRLTDFGLASVCDSATKGAIAKDRIYGYTSVYRPPEVWRSNRWSHSADAWAFGCSLYEMAFGKTLFQEQRPILKDANVFEERKAMLASIEAFCSDFDLFQAETDKIVMNASNGGGGSDERKYFLHSSFHSMEWQQLPLTMRNAIAGCLQLSPFARLTMADVVELLEPSLESIVQNPIFGRNISPDFDSLSRLTTLATDIDNGKRLAVCQESLIVSSKAQERDAAIIIQCLIHDITRDAITSSLAEWIMSKHLAVVHKNRSPRIRNLSLAATAALCVCVAAKVLRRTEPLKEGLDALGGEKWTTAGGGGGCSSDGGGGGKQTTPIIMETAMAVNVVSGGSSGGVNRSAPPTITMEASSATTTFLPPSAKDERALCQGLNHELFPFSNFAAT